MDVAVLGAGRVGTALAVLLQRAGHRVVAVSGGSFTPERAARYLPGTPVRPSTEAARAADLALIAVPDDRIAEVCGELARDGAVSPDRAVAHLSGATGLDALAAARGAGARVLSVHPLQTFPDVESALGRIPGSAAAVTALDEAGYALGERMATDVGARPFRLADEVKPLYHAAAVFASNYLVVVTAVAEELFKAAGLADPLGLFLPLSEASLENAADLGPGAALTGPAVRGDAGTVERNLRALAERAPEAVPAYVALADVALALAERAGRLRAEGRAVVRGVLDRWR